MNLANLYDYVPLRVFAPDGDVHHFILATGASPWAIYAMGGYLVLWAVVDFYRAVLPHGRGRVGFVTQVRRAVVLIMTTAILFGYFAIPGLEESDPVSLFMARTSLLAIPVIVVLLWPRFVLAAAPLGLLRSAGRCGRLALRRLIIPTLPSDLHLASLRHVSQTAVFATVALTPRLATPQPLRPLISHLENNVAYLASTPSFRKMCAIVDCLGRRRTVLRDPGYVETDRSAVWK